MKEKNSHELIYVNMPKYHLYFSITKSLKYKINEHTIYT